MEEIKWIEENEKAYILRLSEFGKPTYEIVIVPNDPTIECRIEHKEYVEKTK